MTGSSPMIHRPTSTTLRRRAGAVLARLLSHLVLLAGAGFMVLPFVWMVLTALRPSGDAFDLDVLSWFSDIHAVQNFGQVLTETQVLRFMLNGMIVCFGILFVQIATALPCAYALAKLTFRGRGLLLAIVLVGLAIPFQVPALPLFLGLADLGLLDTYFSLMFPFFVSAFALFLLRQFIKTFPDEIIAAARLDGFGEVEILLRLILPAAWPAIAAFSVFSVTYHWNDLYWPLIVISSTELAPPTLGILFYRDAETGDSFGPLMAAATLITAPLVIFFLFAQRRFVQGITMTGIR